MWSKYTHNPSTPRIDEKGSGEWVVYFESGSLLTTAGTAGLTIHKWKFPSKKKAVAEAVRVQRQRGGYVTVLRSGIEVVEVGPAGVRET